MITGIGVHDRPDWPFTITGIRSDLFGRWLAAKQWPSFKCLVLDLDNTVWVGVIGDDGPEGITLVRIRFSP